MTNFERTYMLNRQPIATFINASNDSDYLNIIRQQKEEIALRLQYRELDRLSMELEKEIQYCKALRAEMQKYKIDFNLSVKDEATNKIKEVIDGIDKILE